MEQTWPAGKELGGYKPPARLRASSATGPLLTTAEQESLMDGIHSTLNEFDRETLTPTVKAHPEMKDRIKALIEMWSEDTISGLDFVK